MPHYQKAYLLKQLRAFPGWTETRVLESPKDPGSRGSGVAQPDGPEALTDESIVYVQENLTVSESCFETDKTLFDKVTPEWERFCKEELKFAVPDWEEESRIVREQLAKKEKGPSESV